MAIAYMKLSIVSRGNTSQNKNCIASAAYNSRSKLHSTDNNHTYNYYSRHNDVEHEGILLPPNAPKEYADRQTLWQAVEDVETSDKAQLARKIILALPKETNYQQRKFLVEDYCKNTFVNEGMCVDYAIHKPDKGNDNYHAHIMLTMRSIDEQGNWQNKKSKIYELDKNGNKIPIIDKETGQQKIGDKGRKLYKTKTIKTNDWDNPQNLEKWRHKAEVEINKYLQPEQYISMKSYERQGIDKVGQLHEGYIKDPAIVQTNKDIKQRNFDVVKEEKKQDICKLMEDKIQLLQEQEQAKATIRKYEKQSTIKKWALDKMELNDEYKEAKTALNNNFVGLAPKIKRVEEKIKQTVEDNPQVFASSEKQEQVIEVLQHPERLYEEQKPAKTEKAVAVHQQTDTEIETEKKLQKRLETSQTEEKQPSIRPVEPLKKTDTIVDTHEKDGNREETAEDYLRQRLQKLSTDKNVESQQQQIKDTRPAEKIIADHVNYEFHEATKHIEWQKEKVDFYSDVFPDSSKAEKEKLTKMKNELLKDYNEETAKYLNEENKLKLDTIRKEHEKDTKARKASQGLDNKPLYHLVNDGKIERHRSRDNDLSR